MTLIAYDNFNFTAKSELEIQQAVEIIEEYEVEGYTLTLRQLYYQFVARGLRENTERSYKNLGNIITKARLAGMISWEAIEDRNRGAHFPYVKSFEKSVLKDIEFSLSLDKWRGQEHYVEVWIEKEALGNVIERPCDRLRVPYMSCKGYLSSSEAWSAGRRFQEAMIKGLTPVLIHLGDHDPSGIDMTRDNGARVNTFTMLSDKDCEQLGADEQDTFNDIASFPGVEVRRIALNMDQVDEYAPPPNPTKLSDSRARDYIRKFGRTSWELDALEPSVIEALITDEVEQFIDREKWDAVVAEQEERRAYLKQLHGRWDDIKGFLDND